MYMKEIKQGNGCAKPDAKEIEKLCEFVVVVWCSLVWFGWIGLIGDVLRQGNAGEGNRR